MVRFGADLLSISVLTYLGRMIDVVLLGGRFGGHAVGLYERATKLMMLPATQVNAPVTSVALPALSRVADDGPRYREAYIRFVDKVLLVTMPGIACLIATSDWVVAVLMGDGWEEAARIFAILGVGMLLSPHQATFGWLFVSQARTREMRTMSVLETIARIALVAAALPWGATGVATAVTARAFLLFPAWAIVAGRRGPVRTRDLFGVLVAPFAAAAMVFAAVFALRLAVDFRSPVHALLVALPLAGAAALLVLLALPNGRAALADLRNAVMHVLGSRQAGARVG
jgi:PST family polysaccharide transporter